MRLWIKARPPLGIDEGARQRAVGALGEWQSASEDLDEIAAAAAHLLATPAAMVTIIDHDTMWVAGAFNTRFRSLERNECVCTHGLVSPADILCVPDLQADERFAKLPVAKGADALRFYIGTPVVTSGQPVGMLCGFDQTPRPCPSDEHYRALQRLAKAASARLERRTDYHG